MAKRKFTKEGGEMGTNFYWKAIPRELEKYKANVEKYIGAVDDNPDNVLLHIGKRSAAGLYCYYCGTTLCKNGADFIHTVCEPYEELYKVCPICGKEGTYICTFRWTFMLHKWLIEVFAKQGRRRTDKCIVDENGKEYTPQEFLNAVETPIEYQSCCEFS